MKLWISLMAIVAVSVPAYAQLGGLVRKAQQAQERKQQFDDLNITEAEEIALGAAVSAKVRERFGVVQNPAVHKYVSLAGTVLTEQSARPNLPWTFIVLDTDGVNAFAAPGGYVHITRGALGLIKTEAELVGVLGHEISHVTQKHTVNALRKSKGVQLAAGETLSNRGMFLDALANRTYDMVLENSFDRGDELDADKEGILLAQKAGYAGTGLGDFLTGLAGRNKDQAEKNGLFASHPETQERIAKVRQLAGAKPGAAGAARYASTINYRPTDITRIAVIVEGSAGLTGGGKEKENEKEKGKKDEEPKRRGFGLGNLTKSVTGEKQSQQVAASGGARGVGRDRLAKGGDNPNPVRASISPDDLATFKKGIV